MLQPSRVKWQTSNVGYLWNSCCGFDSCFRCICTKTVEPGYLNSRQIESARRTMIRLLRKGGKLWIRIFPDKPYTKKPLEVPMGGGKGSRVPSSC